MSDRKQIAANILKKDHGILFEAARKLSVISGKVDEIETFLLFRAILEGKGDHGISDSLNDILMLTKLRYSDHINECKVLIDRQVSEVIRRAEELEETRKNIVERQRAKAEADAKSLAYAGIPYIGDDNKAAPSISIRDAALNLIDRIKHGNCFEISDEEQLIVKFLWTNYGVALEQKGWLTRTWAFTDTLAAEQARALIVLGMTK